MKKLIVISDTHGSLKGIEKLRALIDENDYLIHLGDGAGDIRGLFGDYPDKVYACSGNCDYNSPFPSEGILEVENIRIFYCHGHNYGVKSGLGVLAQEAKKRDCQVALYGHTHRADISEIDGITLINSGSLRLPAGEGGSYCYMVVHKDKVTPVIVGDHLWG